MVPTQMLQLALTYHCLCIPGQGYRSIDCRTHEYKQMIDKNSKYVQVLAGHGWANCTCRVLSAVMVVQAALVAQMPIHTADTYSVDTITHQLADVAACIWPISISWSLMKHMHMRFAQTRPTRMPNAGTRTCSNPHPYST